MGIMLPTLSCEPGRYHQGLTNQLPMGIMLPTLSCEPRRYHQGLTNQLPMGIMLTLHEKEKKIKLPRVSRDWFIFPASLARLSCAPLRPIFSLPARSTRFSFPIRRTSSPLKQKFYKMKNNFQPSLKIIFSQGN